MKIDLNTAVRNNLICEVKIRFNGLELKNCIFADEDNGLALVYDYEMWDKYKKFSIYYDGIELPKKILKGDVWIMFGDRK